MIQKDDIEHLARLSRIKLTEEEKVHFSEEISSILDYVSAVQKLTTSEDIGPTLTPRFNIFRSDEVSNEPGSYTDDLLKSMPKTSGRHLQVKKILHHD